jgi:adenosylhomocysteine nucleosidase
MKILVTFAVDAEFAPWRKLRRFRSIDYDGLRLLQTDIGDAHITTLLTGMGGEASTQAMGLMMHMADEDRHFDVCISSGLAGALEDKLSPGDIIAPRLLKTEIRYGDSASEELSVDVTLHEQAFKLGAICSNCLLTTDRVLVKADQKKECSSRAQLVDMESFEIIKQALAWGARGIVVRAISDTANEDLPIDFNQTVSPEKQISIPKVLLQLAKNPFALPALLRFGKQSRKAAESLAVFLDRYVQILAEPASTPISREAAAR